MWAAKIKAGTMVLLSQKAKQNTHLVNRISISIIMKIASMKLDHGCPGGTAKARKRNAAAETLKAASQANNDDSTIKSTAHGCHVGAATS